MVDEEFGGLEDSGPPTKKKNLFLVIIIAAVVIGIGAAGFFAGKMMSGGKDNGKDDSKKTTQTDGNTQKNPTNNAGETGTKPADNGTGEVTPGEGGETPTDTTNASQKKAGILALDAFTVNLNDPFGRRYLEVVINLVINDKNLVPKIKENELLMPKIRHEIFMTISAKSFNDLNNTSGKIALFEEIQMRVNEIIKQELGVEPVSEVLETRFLMQ